MTRAYDGREKWAQRERERRDAQPKPKKVKTKMSFDSYPKSPFDRAVDLMYPGGEIRFGGGYDRPRPRSREEELELRCRESEEKTRTLTAFVEGLNKQPCSYVTVIGASAEKDKWLVRRGNETLEVQGPPGLIIVPGRTVRVLTQTMNILSVVDAPPAGGEVVRVVAPIDATSCEVAYGQGTRAVLQGSHKVEAGDRVVLDASNTVVVKNLGPERSDQLVSVATGVTWDDIGGQADAKAAMREAVEGPVLNREIYKRYGRRPTKGVLLYGPPGNGKTMLGKAAASALAALHGSSAGASGFLYVKGPELLSSYVGASEQGVRGLFDSARKHKAQHGYPAVVFLDEAEALLGRRGAPGLSAALASTLVPTFLAEMDGMTESGALVILATNRPDALDPAVVREGRIDRKVLVGRPTRDCAFEIFRRHLASRPLAADLDTELLAVASTGALYDESHVLYRVLLSGGKAKSVTLGHLTSGAQIAAIVDVAASMAIDRELAGDTAAGIGVPDVERAVVRTMHEHRAVDHSDELALFVEPFRHDVQDIERVGADGRTRRPSLITDLGRGPAVTISSGGAS